jgi:hypothetical protein
MKLIQREVASSPIVSRIVGLQPRKRDEIRATVGLASASAERWEWILTIMDGIRLTVMADMTRIKTESAAMDTATGTIHDGAAFVTTDARMARELAAGVIGNNNVVTETVIEAMLRKIPNG